MEKEKMGKMERKANKIVIYFDSIYFTHAYSYAIII